MTLGPANSQSSYLGADFDIPKDAEGIRNFMDKRERLTATIVNIKENGQYEKRELLSGKQIFSFTSGNAIQTNYIYRLTFDLVELNFNEFNLTAIPAGATTLTLSDGTEPPIINIPNSISPLCGYGAATNATTIYFINDPLVFVRINIWTNGSQTITITNNTGSDLTQCFWVLEYYKN